MEGWTDGRMHEPYFIRPFQPRPGVQQIAHKESIVVTYFKLQTSKISFLFFFNCGSLHVRLNSHYKSWSYKKKIHKKIKANRKSLYKEPTFNRCLLMLILDLKQFRSLVKEKHYIGREIQGLAV